MRKLKTSLKPTVKATNVLDVKMENLLSKNPVVTVLYTRNDNRYLVCKSASTFKLGFPVIKPIIVNFAVQTGKSTSKDIANQVIDIMRKEFGLDPEILNYYEGTKRPYVYQNEYLKGNDTAFDTRDAGQYVGKPEIVKNPSGEYTDERWLTLSEINDLMNQGLFDENSSYYATRCSEAKSKRAILDPRLSLHVYADKDGVHFNNNSKDQMPLKTLNGNGLQKLEETEDYCIYICKDAIMTTVEKYAPGAYQKFQETQALINSNDGLLKEYSIDWVNKDDADLFIQINNDEVAKIESQPMMLPVEGEEPTRPMVLDSKTVPTTYDCCFTVRKDDNYSLYINEGYENLFPIEQFYDYGNGDYFKSLKNSSYIYNVLKVITLKPNLKYYIKYEEVKNVGINSMKVHINQGSLPTLTIQSSDKISDYGGIINTTQQAQFQVRFDAFEVNTEIKFDIKKPIIVKSDIQKPFVKSIQPNCKVAFETPATYDTHSFIMKGINQNNNVVTNRFLCFQDGNMGNLYGVAEGINLNNSITAILLSNLVGGKTTNSAGRVSYGLAELIDGRYMNLNNTLSRNDQMSSLSNLINLKYSYSSVYHINSFKQLLIYKGNLTEAELKVENEKYN